MFAGIIHQLKVNSSQKNIFYMFFAVGILISTLHLSFFYYSHDTPKWFIFDLFTSLYIIFSLKSVKKLQYSYPGSILLILSYFMLVSLWWAPHKIAGVEFIIRFVNASLLAYCLIKQFNKDQLIELFLNTVFWSALAFICLFITERYILSIPYNPGTFSPVGYINNAGAVFNIWIPALVLFAFKYRNNFIKLAGSVFVLIMIISILMEAATRGTIIGLTLSELIVFLIVFRTNVKQSFLYLSITLSLVTGIGVYQLFDSFQSGRLSDKMTLMQQSVEAASSGRLNMFQNTWNMTLDNPLGVGINNFEYMHPKYAQPGTSFASPFVDETMILRTPHNLLLKLYSELGYTGGTIFAFFLILLFASAIYNAWVGNFIDKWLFVCVSATLFHSMFSAVLLTPATLFFAIILFATVSSRSSFNKIFSFSVRLPGVLKIAYLLLPLWATSTAASEYYAYKGWSTFDEKQLDYAIKLNPGNDRAMYNLAQIRYYRNQDVAGSLQAINQFIELYPYHIAALLMKAERHYQLGDMYSAALTVNKLLSFYPNNKKAIRLKEAIKQKQIIKESF